MSIAYVTYFTAGRLLAVISRGWKARSRSRSRYHFDREERRWVSLSG